MADGESVPVGQLLVLAEDVEGQLLVLAESAGSDESEDAEAAEGAAGDAGQWGGNALDDAAEDEDPMVIFFGESDEESGGYSSSSGGEDDRELNAQRRSAMLSTMTFDTSVPATHSYLGETRSATACMAPVGLCSEVCAYI
jgi:hypothetical protein